MNIRHENYASLIKRIEELIAEENPCNIIDGQCEASRLGKLLNYNTCCRRCSLLSNKGCTTKVLGCKLYFCGVAMGRMTPAAIEEINFLRIKGTKQGFHLIVGEPEVDVFPEIFQKADIKPEKVARILKKDPDNEKGSYVFLEKLKVGAFVNMGKYDYGKSVNIRVGVTSWTKKYHPELLFRVKQVNGRIQIIRIK